MLSEKIPKITVDQFAQEVTMGKLASEVMAEAKKITAIRHLGIRKTKLISTRESRAVEEAKPVEAASPAA
jgi:small subunit ribosomal protein S3Ae